MSILNTFEFAVVALIFEPSSLILMASLLEMLIASLCFNVAALYCIYHLTMRLWARQKTAETESDQWEVVEQTPMVNPTPVENPTPMVNPTPVGNPTPMVNPTPVNQTYQTPPPPPTGIVTIFKNKRGRAAGGRAGRSVCFQLDTDLVWSGHECVSKKSCEHDTVEGINQEPF